jgi:hypothetical protein
MPVTFATDLRDLKDYGYVEQIPIEALFKNLGYKQAKYDEGARKMKSLVDTLSIRAVGQDAEKRDEILNQVNQELKKFENADLSNPQIQTQLTNFISQVASSKDFTGIAARTYSYDKLQEKKKKLLADGKTRISAHNMQVLTDAEDYFMGNQPYDPDKRFTGDIQADTDFNAVYKGIGDNTPEYTQALNDGKYITTSKGKVEAQLYNNANVFFSQNPALVAEKRREFDSKYKGVNFYVEDRLGLEKTLSSIKTTLYNNKVLLENEKRQPGGGNPKKLNEYQAIVDKATADYGIINDQYNQLSPEKTRNDAFAKWLNNQNQEWARSSANFDVITIAPEEYYKASHASDLKIKEMKKEYDLKENLERIKGNTKNAIDGGAATSVMDVWNDLQSNENLQTPSSAEGDWWRFGMNVDKEAGTAWNSTDFSRTFNISTGITGDWVPVQNISAIQDMFGTTSSVVTKEDGSTITTKAKTVVATFKSKNPGQLLIIQKEGDTYIPVIVTTNSFRDAVIQRLSGSNFDKNKEAIKNKPLIGDSGNTGEATEATGATGSSGTIGSSGISLPAVTDSSAAADSARRKALPK